MSKNSSKQMYLQLKEWLKTFKKQPLPRTRYIKKY